MDDTTTTTDDDARSTRDPDAPDGAEEGTGRSRRRSRGRGRSRRGATSVETEGEAGEAPADDAGHDDTTPESSTSESSTPDDAEAPAPATTRARASRTRVRARAAAVVADADDADQATSEDVDDAEGDTEDGDAPTDTDGAAPRRRRGRRGGRGRRGRSSAGGEAGAGPGRADERGEAGGSDDGDDDEDDDEDDDRDPEAGLERAIARGSTRLAARQAPRRGDAGGSRRRERPGGVSEEVRRAILEGPPRTMLVTAREDRTQVAVLEDRSLVEHYVTRAEDVTYVGNIYMGRVQNVLPGMEAAFIDIGKGRNGVLYAGEVLYDELDLEEEGSQRIENVLKPGQKVLVQVTKDPMGSKGPRLTMHLSLAGRYLVLAPNSDLFGISRKLTDNERDRLRRIVKTVKPEGHGIIVRTAAEGATEEQVVSDVARLLAKWEKVEAAAAGAKALASVYEEPPLVVKVIRDNFGPGFERCIVDDETLHDQVRDYLDEVAPELLDKVELYGAPTDDARSRAAGAPGPDDAPEASPSSAADRRRALPSLFDAYDVADQLRKAMSRKVWLPSGGYLIIESTEAMKVIDVNTGKFTGGPDANLEEIVLKTNLEAADEIVRQLRLRDMGGMIVIDFIDMLLKSNQDQVVRRLKRELLRDRTKTRVSEVSRLGLVQMTRKNVSQGLVESFSHTCETCEGRGFISELV